MVVPGAQVPAPSQVRTPIAVPPEHIAAAHIWPIEYWRQAPAPLQLPSCLQLARPSSPQSLWGSEPAAAGEHLPAWPATLQAMQRPEQGMSQQTPSMHWLEVHSPARPQAAPFAFLLAQVIPLQNAAVTQSPSPA